MGIIDFAGLTICLSSDGQPERADGWWLLWIDTGETFLHVGGAWVGQGTGFSFAPPTKSGRVTTDANGRAVIVFDVPFVDNQYGVSYGCMDIGTGKKQPLVYTVNQTASGFTIQTRDTEKGDWMPNITVTYVATRHKT